MAENKGGQSEKGEEESGGREVESDLYVELEEALSCFASLCARLVDELAPRCGRAMLSLLLLLLPLLLLLLLLSCQDMSPTHRATCRRFRMYAELGASSGPSLGLGRGLSQSLSCPAALTGRH